MKNFRIWWHRPAAGLEIGPVPEIEIVGAKSQKAVKDYAKRIAQERGWRVIEVASYQARAEDTVTIIDAEKGAALLDGGQSGGAVFETGKRNLALLRLCRNDFKRIFGLDIQPFWNNLTGFDLGLFDEGVVKSQAGQSIKDAVFERWGLEAVNLMQRLLGQTTIVEA